jgi:hypothetical protein
MQVELANHPRVPRLGAARVLRTGRKYWRRALESPNGTSAQARQMSASRPSRSGARATAYLPTQSEVLVTDLVVAETVFVLEAPCEAPRSQVADAIRSLCCGLRPLRVQVGGSAATCHPCEEMCRLTQRHRRTILMRN